jgi:hypothetical protein
VQPSYNGVLLGCKKAVFLFTATWVNLVNAMPSEKKPVTKAGTLYDSIYVRCPEEVTP